MSSLSTTTPMNLGPFSMDWTASTSVISPSVENRAPDICKDLCPLETLEHFQLSEGSSLDGTWNPCEVLQSNAEAIVQRKILATPKLALDLAREATYQWGQVSQDAERISKTLEHLSRVVLDPAMYLRATPEALSDTIEEFWPQFPSLSESEISSLKFTGFTDPLAAVRAELQALKLLMRTGRIQLQDGGVVTTNMKMSL